MVRGGAPAWLVSAEGMGAMIDHITQLDGGFAILGDCVGASKDIATLADGQRTIITDPPYGGIVKNEWDQIDSSLLIDWAAEYSSLLETGGAALVFGGIGTPGNRVLFRTILGIESSDTLRLANLITWKKRRAYGIQHNYLFTREEIAYFIKGDIKKPRVFNVPFLDELRGYDGFDPNHPAKSEYLRRSNVWTDITELFRGKIHVAQKPRKLIETLINAHSNPGDWIIDPFAGSGVTAWAARETGRRFVLVERDPLAYQSILNRWNAGEKMP